MVWGCFGWKGEEVRFRVDWRGEEQRRETFQHFSPPVTTKTTKNSLVTLFPSALPLPSLCHSFLPSFLFICSSHAFFPFPLQIGIKCNECNCEEVELWNMWFDTRKQRQCTTWFYFLCTFQYFLFKHLRLRIRTIFPFFANKCMTVNYKRYVLSDGNAANLPN